MSTTSVRVALRVRPLTEKEETSNCTECITFIPNEPQIVIGKDHAFTYDYVFDTVSTQQAVYQDCVTPLVDKFINGFNATILAYGQTGSGKTFSMGTNSTEHNAIDEKGIVPRFIEQVFGKLDQMRETLGHFDYNLRVSFLELYNEDVIDLLDIQHTFGRGRKRMSSSGSSCEIQIREDLQGQIYWSGVREEACTSPDDLLSYLYKGALCRTTASTDMNTVSSRSHAIFTVYLTQKRQAKNETASDNTNEDAAEQTSTYVSKFHFVDLAGSERLKRTNAQGERAREGISINSGLLALGNVISALGDASRRSSHIPYRDSKLTRLLQDSLGGNSQTLMIACVSPSDTNFVETLSTLKYANRARNIRNRVMINQEFSGSTAEVNQLRSLVTRLKMEITAVRASGCVSSSDSDTMRLRNEVNRLRARIQDVSDELCKVTTERDTLRMERELERLPKEEWPGLLEKLSNIPDLSKTNVDEDIEKALPMIASYQQMIQDLRNQLSDANDRINALQTDVQPVMPKINLSLSRSKSSVTRRGGHRRRGKASNHARSSALARRRGARVAPIQTIPMTHHENHPASIQMEPIRRNSSSENIEQWISETIDSHLLTTDIRAEARESIDKARQEIRLFLKDMEEIEENGKRGKLGDAIKYNCEILNDDDLFKTLASAENMMFFAHLEPDQVEKEASSVERIEPNIQKWADCHDDQTSSVGTGRSRELSSESLESTEDGPMLRMVRQIQSDIRVKEDLVTQLERYEADYSDMKQKFAHKLQSLCGQVSGLKRERESILHQQMHELHSTDGPVSQRERDRLASVRTAQEAEMRQLMSQLTYLRKKYSATTSEIQTTRDKNENMLKSLRLNVDTLKSEKQRLVRRMKEESERLREKVKAQDKELHQLRRKQTREVENKHRLEREHRKTKMALQRRTDESTSASKKLEQLISILRKAVREGGYLDDELLRQCSGVVHLGNIMTTQKNRRVQKRRRAKASCSRDMVESRVTRKKSILDQALAQLVEGKQAVLEMKQLVSKRNQLSQERQEILAEKIELADKESPEHLDATIQQFMDERLDTVMAEISYLNARIHALQTFAAHEVFQEDELDVMQSSSADLLPPVKAQKHVTFADEVIATVEPTPNPKQSNEWLDVDVLDDMFAAVQGADPATLQDMILKLLHSLDQSESPIMLQSLLDDLVALRMDDYRLQMSVQQLEKRVNDLQTTLFVMKKAATEASIEGGKKIKRLEGSKRLSYSSEDFSDDVDSAIDLRVEEQFQQGNIFDRIYNDGLRGAIRSPTWNDYHYQETAFSAVKPSNDDLPGKPLAVTPITEKSMEKSTSQNRPTKPSASPLAGRRDSLSSPEQFLQDVLHGAVKEAIRLPMKPSEFNCYQADRESSTSSIHSRHLRRSSLQSDTFSWSSWSSQASNGGRPRADSLQQTRLPSLREAPSVTREEDIPRPYTALRLASQDHQRPTSVTGGRPSSAFALALERVESQRAQTPTTPTTSTTSVFDRLALGHTRASRAKRSTSSTGNYRHSWSSYDELRRQWELSEAAP